MIISFSVLQIMAKEDICHFPEGTTVPEGLTSIASDLNNAAEEVQYAAKGLILQVN
jgi:hypothetical protein